MRILFLQKRILFPAHTGGQVRTLGLLRHLARWHAVTYLCNLQPGEEAYLPRMRALGLRVETVPWREAVRGSLRFYRDVLRNLAHADPYTACKDYDPALRTRAAGLLAEEPYDLLLCDFVQMARNVQGLEAPVKVLVQHNVEAELYWRQAKASRGWLRRCGLALQARKMRRFEAEAGRQFDAVIAISERDRRVFEREYGWPHVQASEVGVDLEYFQPGGRPERPGRVVFVGSLDWLPNEDGLFWFAHSVWPLVRRACPEAAFQVVGRNPSAAVRRRLGAAGAHVVGTVADVRPYLEEAAVMVVPLLSGSGIRIKIVEAMAMGKAVVSTSLGAEGLPAAPGKHLLLADAPAAFADAVAGLLRDVTWRTQLGGAARELVCPRYAAESAARRFEAICLQTVERCRRARASLPARPV